MGEVNGYDSMVDAELVLQFQEGSEKAFDDLVRRHREAAYRFCLRLTGQAVDAEEVSQEGFIRAYRRLSSFRGEAHFRSWLFRILINLHRDRIRSQRRREGREELLSRKVAQNLDVGAELQAQELQNLLHYNHLLLNHLNQKMVLLLQELDFYSVLKITSSPITML